jgi:two-component system invasion response regulator UvrY
VVAAQISRRAGKYRLDRPHAHPSLALLTARELQVMTLLARGYSVRRCAQQLGLAESTIDNHKSRLMKKLDIHKVVELTHLAIREGLIVV